MFLIRITEIILKRILIGINKQVKINLKHFEIIYLKTCLILELSNFQFK